MKLKLLLVLIALATVACGVTGPPPVEAPTPRGISRFNVGIVNSDVMRVPIDQDGVVCYVAVEASIMKSINCIQLKDLQLKKNDVQLKKN